MLMQLVWQAISGIVTKPWRRLSTRQVLAPPVIRLGEIGQDGAGGDCPAEAALVIIRSDHCGTKGRGDDTDRVGACD